MAFRAGLCRTLIRRRLFGTVALRSAAPEPLGAVFPPPPVPETSPILDRCASLVETAPGPDVTDFRERLGLCESVSEVCALFAATRGRAAPGELLLLLSGVIRVTSIRFARNDISLDDPIEFVDPAELAGPAENVDYFPPTEFCLVSLNRPRPVNVKRLDIGVSQVFVDLINRFGALSVEHILYLNRMCEFLKGYHGKVVLASSEDRIGPELPRMEPLDLVRTALALASRSENVEFVKAYIAELFQKMRLLSADQRTLVFETMAGAKRCSSLFLRCFGDYLSGLAKREGGDALSAGDRVRVLAAYARNPKCISRELFRHLLASCLATDLEALSLSNVLDLVWVANKFNNVDLFLPRVLGLLADNLGRVGQNALAMLISAYSNSALADGRFHSLLERAALEQAAEMAPKNVALCAYGLALKADVIANIGHFNGLDLAMLAAAYARALAGSAALHQCIQEAVLGYAGDLPADCLAKVLVAYAHISGRRSLFSGLMVGFLERVHQFPPHELAQVLWAYLAMRFHDAQFWATCLEVVAADREAVARDPRCHLLYPVLRLLTQRRRDTLSVGVVPASPDVARLMNHTRRHFLASQAPSPIAGAVAEAVATIPGVEAVRRNVDEDAFLVDVAFTHAGAGHALLVYSRANTFNEAPVGALRVKERFLALRGGSRRTRRPQARKGARGGVAAARARAARARDRVATLIH